MQAEGGAGEVDERWLAGFRVQHLGTEKEWCFSAEEGGPRAIYLMGRHARFSVGSEEFVLGQGDVLLVRDGPVSGEGRVSFVELQYPEDLYREAPDIFGTEGGRPVQAVVVGVPKRERTAFETHIVGLFREQETRLPGLGCAIRAHLLALLTFLYRLHRGVLPYWTHYDSLTSVMYRHRVLAVVMYVERNYQETLHLSDLAQMAGLNRTTFTDIYKALTGFPPRRHLLDVRIRRARQLLEQSTMPVEAIASAVGFRDLSAFYRAFRRRCGCSPLALRTRRP